MISNGDLFLVGSVVSFTALAGAYVYVRTAFRRRTVKRHAGHTRSQHAPHQRHT